MSDREIHVLAPDQEMNHPGRPQPPADEVTRRLFEDASGSVVQVTGDGGRTSRGGPINGSGFFIGNDGLVATNAHVALRNNEIFVRADGRLYRASVVAADDVKDVAILRLEGFQPQQARPLSVGNSTQLQSNERVFALGHPESVRSTYISPGNYRNRTNLLSVYASNGGEQRLFNAMAQVRARTAPEEFNDFNSSLSQDVLDGQVHIRPGSSGGPLLNTSGRAVGMARTMERDSRSTSYFLPIEDVTSTLNDPESNKFAFKYEFQPAPLARDYMYMWSDNPVKAAIGTGMLAGVGYTGYRAMEVRPRVMAGALGLYGAASMVNDSSQFFSSTNDRDSLRYGLASLSDVAVVAGSVASFFPRTRGIGRWAMTLGVGGQIGSSFIPNRLVLTDINRRDGSPRPPFMRDELIDRITRTP